MIDLMGKKIISLFLMRRASSAIDAERKAFMRGE